MRNYREVAEAVLERRDAYEKRGNIHAASSSGQRQAQAGSAWRRCWGSGYMGRLPVTGQRRDVTVRFRDLLRPV